MSNREDAWEAHYRENDWYEYPGTAREAFLAGWDAATERAYEQAAKIAEQDATGVTLRDFKDFDVVRQTGQRIAFNIQAAAHKAT